MNIKKIQAIIWLTACSLMVHATDTKPLEFNVAYIGNAAGNAAGGIKQGAGYLGYATLQIDFSTEAAGWWRGGTLCVGGGNTHGCKPSAEWLGDFQCANNVEAGNHTFMEQLWFCQQWSGFSATAGLLDLNADYAVCDVAGDFLNSSFGIHPTLATHLCAPIFPITGLGLHLRYEADKPWAIQAAVYDGGPIGFEDNPYNVRWQLSRSKGYLCVTEGQYMPTIGEGLPGTYKLGFAYHTGEHKYGWFLSSEQTVWMRDKQQVIAFVQAAYNPQKYHENYAHIGGGVAWTGVFSKAGDDKLGLGGTCAFLDDTKRHETSIECFYKYQLLPQLYIQPDIQYIINPAADPAAKNYALAISLRFGIDLNL